jgi:hypothetical protein
MGKHTGRFKWKKYSKYRGNLQPYWTDKNRTTDRHRMNEYTITIKAQSKLNGDELLDLLEFLIAGALTMSEIDLVDTW